MSLLDADVRPGQAHQSLNTKPKDRTPFTLLLKFRDGTSVYVHTDPDPRESLLK